MELEFTKTFPHLESCDNGCYCFEELKYDKRNKVYAIEANCGRLIVIPQDDVAAVLIHEYIDGGW